MLEAPQTTHRTVQLAAVIRLTIRGEEIYVAGPESSSDSANFRTELIRPLVGPDFRLTDVTANMVTEVLA